MSCSMLRFLTLFVLLNLAALPALAQSQRETGAAAVQGQISGQVRNAEGGTPIFNALVTLDNWSSGYAGQTTTDRTGKFRFSGIGGNQYNVTVRAPGFREERQMVDLSNSPSAYTQFALLSDGTGVAATTNAVVVDPKTPEPARREYEAGLREINGGSAEKGIPHLEKAITLYPNFIEAQMLLGSAYMDTKQWDKAEQALRRAVGIDPKSQRAYFALGEMFYQQKKYKEAEKEIKDGLKLDDKSWQGHLLLGRVYMDMGDIPKAGPEVGTALRIKPDLAEGHLLAGNLLLKARQAENALAEFQEYLRLEPKGKFAAQAQQWVDKIKKALAESKK